jgi:hypothetical protein
MIQTKESSGADGHVIRVVRAEGAQLRQFNKVTRSENWSRLEVGVTRF